MPAERVNQYERAFRAWPLLTATAAKRSTISYVELAEYLHIHRKIVCLRSKVPGHRWTEADRYAAIVLNGRPVALPFDARLRPSDASLAYRARRMRS